MPSPDVMVISTQTPDAKLAAQIGIAPGRTGQIIKNLTGGGYIHLHQDKQLRPEEARQIEHVSSKGWLVITGHGSPGAVSLQGAYLPKGGETEAPAMDITASANDYVNLAMQKLKKGDHINVLLSVCYGGASFHGQPSFAQQLAHEFAIRGVSSHIVASTKPVGRIGAFDEPGDIPGEKLRFRADKEDIRVFDTKASLTPQSISSAPYDHFEITKEGLEFSRESKKRLLPLQEQAHFKNLTREEANYQLRDGEFVIRPSSSDKEGEELVLTLVQQGSFFHGLITRDSSGQFSTTIKDEVEIPGKPREDVKVGPARSIAELAKKLKPLHLQLTEFNRLNHTVKMADGNHPRFICKFSEFMSDHQKADKLRAVAAEARSEFLFNSLREAFSEVGLSHCLKNSTPNMTDAAVLSALRNNNQFIIRTTTDGYLVSTLKDGKIKDEYFPISSVQGITRYLEVKGLLSLEDVFTRNWQLEGPGNINSKSQNQQIIGQLLFSSGDPEFKKQGPKFIENMMKSMTLKQQKSLVSVLTTVDQYAKQYPHQVSHAKKRSEQMLQLAQKVHAKQLGSHKKAVDQYFSRVLSALHASFKHTKGRQIDLSQIKGGKLSAKEQEAVRRNNQQLQNVLTAYGQITQCKKNFADYNNVDEIRKLMAPLMEKVLQEEKRYQNNRFFLFSNERTENKILKTLPSNHRARM